MNKKIIWAVVIIVILGLAYYLLSPLFIVKTANDSAPTGSSVLRGQLVPSAHSVSGSVSVVENGGQKSLRFENLDTTNGPDLYIYLATDTSASDYVDLGKIKATKGNVNYNIPSGTDLNKYGKVLIWCKQFHVLFSYAELK